MVLRRHLRRVADVARDVRALLRPRRSARVRRDRRAEHERALGTRARAESRAPALQLETLRREGHTYVVNADDGARVQLTLDPRLQEPIEDVLRTFQIPYAGAVVVSIPDGRVLAMVGRSAAQPTPRSRTPCRLSGCLPRSSPEKIDLW